MKVLLIAAGRRVSLSKRFIAHGFEVYSYEIEKQCPISITATIIGGKKWNDPDIREHLVETINNIKPDLTLPLADEATTILSSIVYPGIITGSGRTNSFCLDKRKFEEKLNKEIYYPIVCQNCPVIFKPIKGANSKGIKKVSYSEYLQTYEDIKETHIAQRLVNGFEISVDAYFNRFSKMIDAVPRQRVEIQGGEVSRSTTLMRDAYGVVEITRQVGERFGLVGPVCAQYIVENNTPYIMEINARFGGGVILSMEAGFDQIQLLKEEWIEHKELHPKLYDWKTNFSMTRYFQEYFYGGLNE